MAVVPKTMYRQCKCGYSISAFSRLVRGRHRLLVLLAPPMRSLLPVSARSSWLRRGSRPASFSLPKSSTMDLVGYSIASRNQYAAHLLTRHMLSASMEQLARLYDLEHAAAGLMKTQRRRLRIVDLGSADGSNSMETLRFAIDCLNKASSQTDPLPLDIVFEEQPASDKGVLMKTLQRHEHWFQTNNATRDILMKSFYDKQLFESGSVDFMMSYICLHWIDIRDSEWKRLIKVIKPTEDDSALTFTQINESTAPAKLREMFQELAHRHLARFLAFRGRELRPGTEALLVMVGHPHAISSPVDGGPSPLTRAMTRCVERGTVRARLLRETLVLYFFRTVEDVQKSFEIASTIKVKDPTGKGEITTPGTMLELVHVTPILTNVGQGAETLDAIFDMMWSIHSYSVQSAGPTPAELECIKNETRQVFDEIYQPKSGIPATFIACAVRRKTNLIRME